MAERGGDKLPVNYLKLREDAKKAAHFEFLSNWIKSGKEPEVQEISRDQWKGLNTPSPDEIVGGDMYPSCIPCYEQKAACLWEFQTLQDRMQRPYSTKPGCERCRLKVLECRFAWGVMDPLMKVDDAMSRLVRHSGSEYRKTERRVAENEAARDHIVKLIAELSKK